VLYISVGAVQIVAGIFFLFTVPVLRIGSNIWTGSWVNNNIIMIISEKYIKEMTKLFVIIKINSKQNKNNRFAV